MSFILDALRRAETQRGKQSRKTAPDSALEAIAEKPSSMPPARWIAVLLIGVAAVAILAVNVLGSRNLTTPGPAVSGYRAATPPLDAPFPTLAPDTPLAEVVTPATREVRPLVREARVVAKTATPPRPATATASSTRRITPGTVTISQEPLSAADPRTRNFSNRPDDEATLASYADTVLSGRKSMPEFHLDIHVYASAPERRFVFVNNRKYREGEQLDEGGTVERITPKGVILNHRGRRFELVPD